MCIHMSDSNNQSEASTGMRVWSPVAASHGAQFTAQRIGGGTLGGQADPFLNVDHFRMSAPTFPPHPHAGFSAVTYLLPESAGRMLNRDGRGDHHSILPGGVHWTAAGSGLVHEEVPDPAGSLAEGMQIFVRQPLDQEHQPAIVHHVEPGAVPLAEIGPGGWVRVVAGQFGDLAAPFTPPSALQMLDIALAPGQGLEWHNPWNDGGVAIYVFSGGIRIDDVAVSAPQVAVFERGVRALRLAATVGDARLILLAGQPLDVPSIASGPFVLSSQAAIDAAYERYRRGDMGTIPA
jgi:redox-sensitive bicupin YhaK (pirin superfamily)